MSKLLVLGWNTWYAINVQIDDYGKIKKILGDIENMIFIKHLKIKPISAFNKA